MYVLFFTNTHLSQNLLCAPILAWFLCQSYLLCLLRLMREFVVYLGKYPSYSRTGLFFMWILVVFMLLFDPLPPPAAGKYNQNKQHCCTQAPSSDLWYRLTVKRPPLYQGERNKCQTSCANFNLKWKRRHPVKNMFGIGKTQFIEMIHWFFFIWRCHLPWQQCVLLHWEEVGMK